MSTIENLKSNDASWDPMNITWNQAVYGVQKVAELVNFVSFMVFLTISIVGIPLIVIYSQELKDQFTGIIEGMRPAQPLAIIKPNPPPQETSSPSQEVKTFCDALISHGYPSRYDTTFLDANPSLDTEYYINDILEQPTEENTRFVFIPFILDQEANEHVVVVAIDLKNKTFEYYDPMGGKIEIKTKVKNLKLSLHDFQRKIAKKYQLSVTTTKDNKEKIEKAESHKYLCWFMLQRGFHNNLSEFNAKPKPTLEEINDFLLDEINTAPKKEIKPKDILPETNDASTELKIFDFLPSKSIKAWITTLSEVFHSSKKIVKPFDEIQIPTIIAELTQMAQSGKHTLLSIPLVLEGDHLVFLTLYLNPTPITIQYSEKGKTKHDTKFRNTLEYYDPQGETLYYETKLIRHLNITPADFASLIQNSLRCDINPKTKVPFSEEDLKHFNVYAQ